MLLPCVFVLLLFVSCTDVIVVLVYLHCCCSRSGTNADRSCQKRCFHRVYVYTVNDPVWGFIQRKDRDNKQEVRLTVVSISLLAMLRPSFHCSRRVMKELPGMCLFTCMRMCQRKEWRLKWTETAIYHCDGGCYGCVCVREYITFVLPSFCVFCLLCSLSLRDPVCTFVFGACTHMHLFVLGFFCLYRGASAISSAWTVDPHSLVPVTFCSGWVGVRRQTVYNFPQTVFSLSAVIVFDNRRPKYRTL